MTACQWCARKFARRSRGSRNASVVRSAGTRSGPRCAGGVTGPIADVAGPAATGSAPSPPMPVVRRAERWRPARAEARLASRRSPGDRGKGVAGGGKSPARVAISLFAGTRRPAGVAQEPLTPLVDCRHRAERPPDCLAGAAGTGWAAFRAHPLARQAERTLR
jgi:hypothetical protein